MIAILRVAAVICSLCSLCSCYTILSDVVAEYPEFVQFDRYYTEKYTYYPEGGTEAFYIDETKVVKREITEFHMVDFVDDHTYYFYKGPALEKEKRVENKYYYCFAKYCVSTKEVHVFFDGICDDESTTTFVYDKIGDHDYYVYFNDFYRVINDNTHVCLWEQFGSLILKNQYGEYDIVDIDVIDIGSNDKCTIAIVIATGMDYDNTEPDKDKSRCYLYVCEPAIVGEDTYVFWLGNIDKNKEIQTDSTQGNMVSGAYNEGVNGGDVFWMKKTSENRHGYMLEPLDREKPKKTTSWGTAYKGFNPITFFAGYNQCSYLVVLWDNNYAMIQAFCEFTKPEAHPELKMQRAANFYLPDDDSLSYVLADEMPSVIVMNDDFTFDYATDHNVVGADDTYLLISA